MSGEKLTLAAWAPAEQAPAQPTLAAIAPVPFKPFVFRNYVVSKIPEGERRKRFIFVGRARERLSFGKD